ncbi:MAG: hypothetical protein IJ783_07615 [Kiritimatiellae bacterium]|nr:hypothetical protein [Kiritimatiellia bacterium]
MSQSGISSREVREVREVFLLNLPTFNLQRQYHSPPFDQFFQRGGAETQRNAELAKTGEAVFPVGMDVMQRSLRNSAPLRLCFEIKFPMVPPVGISSREVRDVREVFPEPSNLKTFNLARLLSALKNFSVA